MGLPTLIAELAILPISILLGLRLAPSEMMCVKAHLKNLEHQLMPVESLRGRVDALEQYRHCDQYDDEERKSTSKLRRKKCQS
jgi:hypothetical protein